MTEYEEITEGKNIEELYVELGFQLGLGYTRGDSFPAYIIDKIEILKNKVEIEEVPIVIGYLNRDYGYNGFKKILKGSEVFSCSDRYYFNMILISDNRVIKQYFYKESLVPHIDFINNK